MRQLRIYRASIFIMGTCLLLTGCLPSETPASPPTPTSGGSGSGSGGSGGGSGSGGTGGGVGYGSTKDPEATVADPALGVSYRYYTASTNTRLGQWDITVPAKADGTEDLTRSVVVSATIVHTNELGVDGLVVFTATCGRIGSSGQRTCTVDGDNRPWIVDPTRPKCFINKVDGDTSVDSDGYAAYVAATPTLEFPLSDSAVALNKIPRNFCKQNFYGSTALTGNEKYLSQPNAPLETQTFSMTLLNGMALQVQFNGLAQNLNSNLVTLNNSAVETHAGFSVNASDCTGFPNLATPLFQMTPSSSGFLGGSSPIVFISSKPDATTSFALMSTKCDSVYGATSKLGDYACRKGNNFRDTNYGFELSSIWDGSIFTSGFTCNNYGLRAVAGGFAYVVANSFGGILIYVTNNSSYIGIAADRVIDPSSLVGKSVYGMKQFNVQNPSQQYINSGNIFRMNFSADSTKDVGFSPIITSNAGFTTGGNSKTTQVVPLGSRFDHAFFDVYNSDNSTNGTSDTSILDKYGTADVLRTSGLYQMYDDASTSNFQANTQGIGYFGRLGKHLAGFFVNLDTFGGLINPLNLTGLSSLTNPTYSTGNHPATSAGILWDTGGSISKTNLRVITVSPWFAKVVTTSNRLRILKGGATTTLSTFTISSIVGSQITVSSDLMINASVDDSGVIYAAADGAIDIATQTIQVNCDFASKFPYDNDGNNSANNTATMTQLSIESGGSFHDFTVDGRLSDCRLHLASLTSIDTLVTIAGNETGVNYGIVSGAESAVASAGHKYLAATTPYLNLPLATTGPSYPDYPPGSLIEVIDDGATGSTKGIYLISDSFHAWAGFGGSDDGHYVLTQNGVAKTIGNVGSKPIVNVLAYGTPRYQDGILSTGFMMMFEK